MSEKTRYGDEELAEFKELILKKLAVARGEYETMMKTLMNSDNNGVDDTSPTYKALEEGANTQSKEESRGWRLLWYVSRTKRMGSVGKPAN